MVVIEHYVYLMVAYRYMQFEYTIDYQEKKYSKL